MSKPRLTSVILTVLFLSVTTPMATAQDSIENPYESTPTTLYFHIFDTINRFVINTQPMDSEFFEVGGANFPSTPGTVDSGPSGINTGDGYDLNTIYGYSTAGPVEYEFIENGKPRFHPERGIAATVDLDRDVVPIVYIYFDIRDSLGENNQPSSMPEFNVRVTVQEGDDPGLDANLDEGRDIMFGQQSFHILDANFVVSPGGLVNNAFCTVINCRVWCEDYAPCLGDNRPLTEEGVPVTQINDALGGQEFNGKPVYTPDQDHIIEVAVPMEILQDTIPKKEAYNVRIDWYQTPDPTGTVIGEDEFTQGWLRIASEPDRLNRMDFAIMNPVYFSFIHPQVAGGSLLIHAGGNSPWGTYDVDLDAVTIEITHESGTKVPEDQLKKLLNSNEHVHGLHDEDAQMTYLWDFREHNAELGEYTIEMSLTNDANSAVATGSAKFIVSETEAIGVDTAGEVVEPTTGLDSDEVDTPIVGMVPVIALLGAALLLHRRRSDE